MKTIKQVADELGVSKQAIRDKIAKLGLQSSLQKKGNQLCISKSQENLIKSTFSQNKSQSETQSKSQSSLQKNENKLCNLESQNNVEKSTISQNKSQSETQSESDRFIKEISELRIELKVERNHSRQLTNKIAELAEREQQLTERAYQLIEHSQELELRMLKQLNVPVEKIEKKETITEEPTIIKSDDFSVVLKETDELKERIRDLEKELGEERKRGIFAKLFKK